VTTTGEFQRRAMELFDDAVLAQQLGDDALSRKLLIEALGLEASAADSVAGEYLLEPTRSVLHRSAATIALQIGNLEQREDIWKRLLPETHRWKSCGSFGS